TRPSDLKLRTRAEKRIEALLVCGDLPAFGHTQYFLGITDDADGGHDRLIDKHINDEAYWIAANFKVEGVKHGLLLFVHDHDDQESDGHDEQGQRSHDVVITEQRKNDAGQKDKRVKKIEEG